MKQFIILSIFFLTSFISLAGPADTTQSIMFSSIDYNLKPIDLRLNQNNPELVSEGAIALVTGLGFMTFGIIMEQNRIQRNQPALNGYSPIANRNFNYFVTGIGIGISSGGVWAILKGLK